MNDTTHDDAVQHVAKLVERAPMCMFVTMTADGQHVSRPMAVQEAEFDGDLWFFSYQDSDKITQIGANPQVNVSFSNDDKAEWTSISGSAEVVHDRAKAEDLWSKPLEVWFEDGLETPGLVLIKVHAESAEYWDSPSSKVKRLLGAGRALAKDDKNQFPGENHEVRLDR